MDLKPGKLYKMLQPVVAERPYQDERGEWWCDMHALDPGDIIMYVGFYVPPGSQATTFGASARKRDHVLKGDLLLTTHLTNSTRTHGDRWTAAVVVLWDGSRVHHDT